MLPGFVLFFIEKPVAARSHAIYGGVRHPPACPPIRMSAYLLLQVSTNFLLLVFLVQLTIVHNFR